jgi:O-methyltransferase
LYPKLSVGGYCLIDDYGGIPACRAAVDEYRSRNGINEPIQSVDRSCVFWQKAG